MNEWQESRRRLLLGVGAGMSAAALATTGCSARHAASIDDPAWWSLQQAAHAVRERRISPVQLTRACLERIARFEPRLSAFITVTADAAMAQARQAEREIAGGEWRGHLHGIPIALKDNIDTAGTLTTAASAVFAERVPAEDAEVVRRLKSAGAVLLGKLNLHEFAMGTTSAISAYGPVHNPWDLERSAGGSSGGCGAAVAAALCFGAVGTDTGGSIRIPASACGIVGLKPTYGVVDVRGTVPVSASFDHVGPMCRNVADTALMFAVMSDAPVARAFDPRASHPLSALRVGIVDTAPPVCDSEMNAEVQAIFDNAVKVVRLLVKSLQLVKLRMPDLGSIIDSEARAYHAASMADPVTAAKYDPRTRAGIGEAPVPDSAAYARMKRRLQHHRESREPAFDVVDLVVLPTLPTLPVRLRDATDPFAQDACTFAFSLGGWPSISVPCGFSKSGLPVGMLIGGPAFSEPHLLALAQAYENATYWHKRRPSHTP